MRDDAEAELLKLEKLPDGRVAALEALFAKLGQRIWALPAAGGVPSPASCRLFIRYRCRVFDDLGHDLGPLAGVAITVTLLDYPTGPISFTGVSDASGFWTFDETFFSYKRSPWWFHAPGTSIPLASYHLHIVAPAGYTTVHGVPTATTLDYDTDAGVCADPATSTPVFVITTAFYTI